MPKRTFSAAEICYGPMKSGKSRYLVHQAEELYRQGLSFLAFKPLQDTRDGSYIRSRDTACRDIQALGVASSRELLTVVEQALSAPEGFAAALADGLPESLSLREGFRGQSRLAACLIDEVFLLDGELLQAMESLLSQGISIYLCGLDRDFRGEFFPLRGFELHGLTMEHVIERCSRRELLQARCESCGMPAELTQRLINGAPAPYNSPTVLIGDEEYEPRCREHHLVVGKPSLSAAS
jgi:thymidine kinase